MPDTLSVDDANLIDEEFAAMPEPGTVPVVVLDCPDDGTGETDPIGALDLGFLTAADNDDVQGLISARHEYGPAAMYAMYPLVKPHLPSMRVSGIVGNAAHTYGYHRCRHVLPGSDYSVQCPADRDGDPYAASAIDLAFSPAEMRLVTARLMRACKANDPRVEPLREFFGTLNGHTVTGWNRVQTGSRGVGYVTSDTSHLWHVHLSILRRYNNDRALMAGIVSVIIGKELDDMPSLDDVRKVVREEVERGLIGADIIDPPPGHATHENPKWTLRGTLQWIGSRLDAITAELDTIRKGK